MREENMQSVGVAVDKLREERQTHIEHVLWIQSRMSREEVKALLDRLNREIAFCGERWQNIRELHKLFAGWCPFR